MEARETVDLDALLTEVRERVRRKRDEGVYGADVDVLLRTPLPGGRVLADDMVDPVGALAQILDEDVAYDPTSHKPVVGPLVTMARRILIGLLRWWLEALLGRQERINRLLAAAIDVEGRLAPRFGERLARLEQWRDREVAADLHSVYFQARFGGDEPVIRRQSEAFVDLFKSKRRVLDLGCGRGIFLDLLRERMIGGYGVDMDPRMIAQCRERGLDAFEADGLAHLQSLPDASIDGVYARHVAEHILPGDLIAILRELRRVLQPGAPVVFITPNVANLSVGAHTFWLDPSHVRPIPPDLFKFYLEVEGFKRAEITTFEPSERQLAEDVSDPKVRANVKLLNETLFGDRDYAVVGEQPWA
ncbi:MAG TPA: class I SAM-dependent methyltransferase [Candidatus Limnocylindria bacterium]|nr:class I SAM-dependent methyltransferase [Candidatus Limnocylindria bacterium]